MKHATLASLLLLLVLAAGGTVLAAGGAAPAADPAAQKNTVTTGGESAGETLRAVGKSIPLILNGQWKELTLLKRKPFRFLVRPPVPGTPAGEVTDPGRLTGPEEYSHSTLLLSLSEELAEEERAALFEKYGLTVRYRYTSFSGYAVELPEPLSDEALDALIERLMAEPGVLQVTKDYIMHTTSVETPTADK